MITTRSTDVHRVEKRRRLVDAPLASEERFFGKEEVLPVLHVEDGEATQRVLRVAGRDVGAEMFSREDLESTRFPS